MKPLWDVRSRLEAKAILPLTYLRLGSGMS